jgi:outer membrane protein assembly factor BamB
MVQLKSLRFMLVTSVLMLAVPNSQSSVIWASQALANGVALFRENVTVLKIVASLLEIVVVASWMTLAGAVSADMLNMPIVKKSGVMFNSGWSGNDILPRNLLIFTMSFAYYALKFTFILTTNSLNPRRGVMATDKPSYFLAM